MKYEDFMTRHSLKPESVNPESSRYKGVSEKGVELARQRAQELFQNIEKMDRGSIIFIGAASDMPRTASTALIYGDEIKRIVEKSNLKEDIQVIMPEDLEEIDGFKKKAEYLKERIERNPQVKFVIDIPLFIKELSPGGIIVNKEKTAFMPYFNHLLEMHRGDEKKAMEEWFKTQGKIGDLQGATPDEIAKRYLEAIRRLEEFAKKYIPKNRPIIIGGVGHSWSLDALAVYLANDGKATWEGLEKIQGKLIGETELVRLTKEGDKSMLEYGDLKIQIIPEQVK